MFSVRFGPWRHLTILRLGASWPPRPTTFLTISEFGKMQNSGQVVLVFLAAVLCGGCNVDQAVNDAATGGGVEPLPENIDGTYLIHSQNNRGLIRLPDEMEKMPRVLREVIFANGTMTSPVGGKPTVVQIEIDRTKSPAQVTFTRKLPNGKPATSFGVMAMIDDQLTVCHDIYTANPEKRITQITNGENYITWKLNKEG